MNDSSKSNHTSGGGGPYEPECCGGNGKPFFLYNAETKQCCPNGKVKFQGEQC